MEQGCKQEYKNRYWAQLLVGVVLFALTPFAGANGQLVYLLTSGEESYYQQVLEVFKKALAEGEGGPRVLVSGLDDPRLQMVADSTVVTIGTRASEFALKHFPKADILSLLMPVAAWDELRERLPGSGRRAAVVIDQPLQRALSLGQLLVPSARQVGVVFGPISVRKKSYLHRTVKRRGMELNEVDMGSADNPISVLSPLVQKSDLIIAVADRASFNKSVAKWLLYLSFRQKVAVIGFSQSYAKAGAIGAVYSSPENIGRHGAELIMKLLAQGESGSNATEFWGTNYPKYYTLAINREVANVLNIPVPELELLYRDFQLLLEFYR